MEFIFACVLLAAVLFIPAINAVVPNLVSEGNNIVAERGDNVTLVCLGSNVRKLDTYVFWMFNGKEIEGSTNKRETEKWLPGKTGRFSLHIKNVSKNDIGEYNCRAEINNFYDKDSSEASIRLQLYESVLNVTTLQPNITLDEGTTTTLRCKVTCSEAIDVWTFWLFNGEMVEAKPFHRGDNQALSNIITNFTSLELKHVTLAQGGTYTCIANSSDILSTQNITLRVKDTEGPTLIQTKTVVKVTDGKNATLSCDAVYPAASFVDTFWIFNGSRIHTYGNSSKYGVSIAWFERSEGTIQRRKLGLMIYNVRLNDSGWYTCVLNTSHGFLQKNLSVRVRKDPSPTNDKEPTSVFSVSDKTGKESADLLVTTLFIGLGLFVGLLTTAMLLLKLWRRRRIRYLESTDAETGDFEYDAFITYSRKDFSWVDEELLSLFNKNHVKYCVDHLHFELGKPFLENMAEGIFKSRKVVAVWSKNYASGKHCKQELDFALNRSFERCDSAIIVIRIDGTDHKQLPKQLRARTFLDYSDSVERKGWEKRLIKHLKPQTQNTQALITML